jgi:hypothetical protein
VCSSRAIRVAHPVTGHHGDAHRLLGHGWDLALLGSGRIPSTISS